MVISLWGRHYAIYLTISVSSTKRSRKRSRNPSQWKKNKAKEQRAHGLEYTNAKGVVVPAKTPKLDIILCTEKCRRECSQITDDDRVNISQSFYSLDTNAKNTYLFNCVTPMQPVTQLVGAKRHRELSYQYHIIVNTRKVNVCKLAFINLHQITNSKVDHILRQVRMGLCNALPSAQGKHDNRPHKLPQEKKAQVMVHISSFPADESHYSRSKNPHRKYLSPILTISAMYKQYKIWCEGRGIDPVSERSYQDIFNTEFNLGFGSPKSDTCSQCDRDEGNDEHKQRVETGFQAQKIDREKAKHHDNVHFISFDLQKTLPLPKLSTSVAFYLRQLWLYNVGIHLISKINSKPYMEIWTEDQAGRGCEEIGSSLLAFLDVADINGGHLIAWSDSCAGQNKNFFILCLWQYLIKCGRLDTIDHKFPETGHTYMDSDRDFGLIEKIVRKRQNIYSVDEYQDIFAQSQKSRPVVTRMHGKMKKIKTLPDSLGLTLKKVNTQGQRIPFKSGIKWIRIDEFGKYRYRESFAEDEEWKEVNIMKGESNHDVVIPSRSTDSVPIKVNKYNDIMKQMAYIPQTYRPFYQALKSTDAISISAEQDVHETDDEMGDEAEQIPLKHRSQKAAAKKRKGADGMDKETSSKKKSKTGTSKATKEPMNLNSQSDDSQRPRLTRNATMKEPVGRTMRTRRNTAKKGLMKK